MKKKNAKKTITIGFYKTQLNNNSLINKLATCWTAKPNSEHVYSHVELRFSDGSTTSITQDTGYVHYDKNRTLSNAGYTCFYEIDIDETIETIVQEYAMQCNERKIPFNTWAVYWNFLPICSNYPIRANTKAFFCSEYITTLMHKINQCPELIPELTSPTDLYISLKNNPQFAITFNRTLYRPNCIKLLSD